MGPGLMLRLRTNELNEIRLTPQLCTGGAYLIIEGPCALGEVLFIAEFVPKKVGEGVCGKGRDFRRASTDGVF